MITFNGQELFPQKRDDLEKVGTLLAKTTESWEAEILNELHDQHPYLASYSIAVDMRKSDGESGHGMGVIKVGEEAAIPFIVESNRLQPLDIYFDKEGEMHSLTRAGLESTLQTKDIGAPIKPNRGGGVSDIGISHRVLPPFDGKYAFAESLDFTSDQLNVILSTLNEDQLEKVAENEVMLDVLRAYKRNVSDEPTLKIAHVINKEAYGAIESSGIYKVAANSGFHTALVSDATLMIEPGFTTDAYRTVITMGDQVGWANESEVFGVKTASTLKLGYGDEGTGVFLAEIDGKVVASELVKVAGDKITLRGGLTYDMVKSAHVDNNILVAGKTLYMSENWNFVPVEGKVSLVKNAHICTDEGGTASVITKVGSRYAVSTPEFFGLDQLAVREGIYEEDLAAALSRTIEPESLNKIASALNERGRVEFVFPDDEVEKVAGTPQISQDTCAALVSTAVQLAEHLVKEGKSNDEKGRETIDAVLGVGFLNEENVQKFMALIPTLEESKQSVAHLLMASRLGLAVDSGPLRSAMFALDSTIRDLRELRNSTTVRK